MKIALGLEYPLGLRGGVSVLVEKLIEGISNSYEVVLVSPDPPGFKHQGVCSHVHWDPALVSRKSSMELAERLEGHGVALAHLHAGGNFGWGWRIPGQSPLGFLHKRGIACVTTVHVVLGLLDGYCDPKKPLWFKAAVLPLAWFGKLDALRFVSAEVVVSHEGCRRLRRWYWPMRRRFRCIYHSRLPAQPPAQRARETVILCVGHLALRKGQQILAKAFARIANGHPAWNLVMIGPPGPDDCWQQVKDTVTAHQLNERILLPGSRNDTFDFMRRASIYVQPSVFEGLPLALQEAMFSGCACVATRVEGNDELIRQDHTGLLVPPLQPEPLAAALEKLIREPKTRELLGEAAAASIVQRGMTAATMIERHLELYENILRGPARGRQDPDFGIEARMNSATASTRD